LLKALAARWQGSPCVEQDARLAGLRAGHPAVIEEVLIELSPRIRSWCYRRVGPAAALDDVVQEVLLELALALPRFEGHSSLVTYAYRICARVVARQIKRSQRQPLRADAHPEPSSPQADPERNSIDRQALGALLSCLSRLPERRREAFLLCELEGETPEQAARMLGTTPNAVRSRVMHARRELERRMRGHDIVKLMRGTP
jgi:RNA polymerase sigma-70 factor (ECF subfamily)